MSKASPAKYESLDVANATLDAAEDEIERLRADLKRVLVRVSQVFDSAWVLTEMEATVEDLRERCAISTEALEKIVGLDEPPGDTARALVMAGIARVALGRCGHGPVPPASPPKFQEAIESGQVLATSLECSICLKPIGMIFCTTCKQMVRICGCPQRCASAKERATCATKQKK